MKFLFSFLYDARGNLIQREHTWFLFLALLFIFSNKKNILAQI